MSIGPSAACDIAVRSAPSSPVSGTGRTRGPNRSASRSSTFRLRPGATTRPAPIASATATALLPRLPVAPLTSSVSPASSPPASSPPYGMVCPVSAAQRAGSSPAAGGSG